MFAKLKKHRKAVLVVLVVIVFVLLSQAFGGFLAVLVLFGFPVLLGIGAKYLTARFDRVHKPHEDFSMAMYYGMWLVCGLISYGFYGIAVGMAFRMGIGSPIKLAVFAVGYIVGLALKFGFNTIRPNSR